MSVHKCLTHRTTSMVHKSREMISILSTREFMDISNQFLLDNTSIQINVVSKILDLVKDDTLIIHNADFDMEVSINKEMQNSEFKK